VEREKGLKNQTPASITPLFRHPLPCSRIIYFSLVQMAWSLPNGRIPHHNAPTPCPWEEGKGRFLASAERPGQGDQTKVMVAGRGYIRSPVELAIWDVSNTLLSGLRQDPDPDLDRVTFCSVCGRPAVLVSFWFCNQQPQEATRSSARRITTPTTTKKYTLLHAANRSTMLMDDQD
jgi:hypothetical protein